MTTICFLLLVVAVVGGPCAQVCGACNDRERSICIDSICTDLYWMNSRLICNSRNGGCERGGLDAVTCAEAEEIVASGNKGRVVSFLNARAANGIEETGTACFFFRTIPWAKGIQEYGSNVESYRIYA